MKKPVIWAALFIMISGCVSREIPDSSTLIQHRIRVATSVESEKIGMIGTTLIEVKKDALVNLMRNFLIQYINKKIGLNVEQVEISEKDSIKLIATKNKVNGVIILKIKSLKIFSPDPSAQLVKADIMLELTVFDESAQQIYMRTVIDHYEKYMGDSMIEETAGEVIESVLKNALRQYVKDANLKRIIVKFKYGAIGGALAKIL